MPTPAGVYAGKELRSLRERYGFTQVEVADAWGRPQPNLSEIENDQRKVSEATRKLLVATIERLAKEKGKVRA